jgi:hypothetical protein
MASALTRRLLSSHRNDTDLEYVLVKTLCEIGRSDDTDAITAFLCEHPDSNLGLNVLLRRGRLDQVRRLWQVWEKRKPPNGGLSLLGRFEIQESAPMAWEAVKSGDWSAAKDGVMGLLGLDLSGLGGGDHNTARP